LRWWLLPAAPQVVAGTYLGVRAHDIVLGGFFALAGCLLAAILVANIHSGVSSSNGGIYRRERQPVRFWCDTAVLVIFYVGMIAAAVFSTVAR